MHTMITLLKFNIHTGILLNYILCKLFLCMNSKADLAYLLLFQGIKRFWFIQLWIKYTLNLVAIRCHFCILSFIKHPRILCSPKSSPNNIHMYTYKNTFKCKTDLSYGDAEFTVGWIAYNRLENGKNLKNTCIVPSYNN